MHVFHPIWYQVRGGGGAPMRLVHNLLMHVFTPGSSKIEVSETCFFDIVTIQNDHPRYVKHVSACICVFSIIFGYQVRGGGASMGLVHNLLMQVFTPGSSKIAVSETCFFDVVTSQNDHPRYVKHVSGCICVFSITFGYQVRGGGGGGGGLPWDWYTTCLCRFSPRTTQKWKFLKLVFLTL